MRNVHLSSWAQTCPCKGCNDYMNCRINKDEEYSCDKYQYWWNERPKEEEHKGKEPK